jgi:hypothetical protein
MVTALPTEQRAERSEDSAAAAGAASESEVGQSGGSHPNPARGPHRELALALVSLVLIGGATALFLRAQALKLEPSPLERPRVERLFSPLCRCATKATATLAFTVRRPLRVDAELVDADERPIRTLSADERWSPGRRTLQWDGRDARGRLGRDGRYRLRVRLLDEGREIVVPTPITLDTTAPRATLLTVAPRAIVRPLRGRAAANPIRVVYRANEVARPTLLADRRPATRRRLQPAGRRVIKWGGRARGRPLPAGRHRIFVQVRDRAGNLSRPTRSVEVRLRRAPRGRD